MDKVFVVARSWCNGFEEYVHVLDTAHRSKAAAEHRAAVLQERNTDSCVEYYVRELEVE
jgi:hypothetical protein